MATVRKIRFFPALLLALATLSVGPTLLAQGDDTAKADQSEKTETAQSSPEALAIYAEAAGFQNNKQFDLAAEEWTKFLKQHEDDPRAMEARYNLAVCQLQQSDFESAVKILDVVVSKADKKFPRLQDAYLNLGWAQYSLGLENQPQLFAKASKTFAGLLEQWPKGEFRDQALFFGGESLYLQGLRDKAVEYYRECVDKHSKSDLYSDAMYALGVTHEELGQFKEAGEVYREFLGSFPDHDLITEVKMREAETIMQDGKYAVAARIFAEVSRVDGFHAADHAHYRHAVCLAQQDEYKSAGEAFSSLVETSPDSPYAGDAAIAAGRSFYRAKEFSEATRWFKEISSTDGPHAPEASHWLARILLSQEKYQEARELVAATLPRAEKHPFFVSLKLDDADALYEMKTSRRESISAYLKISEEHKQHRLAPKALYNAAYGAMEVGDYRAGLDYAKRFTSLYESHTLLPEVQKVLAECNLQLGQAGEAAKTYEKLAASGDKDGTRFELRRGLSLFLEKKYDESIDILSKVQSASASDEEQAEASYWLGRNYASKSQHEKAVTAFQRSLETKQDWRRSDEVLLNLARALRRTDRLSEAQSTVTRLIANYPQSEVLDQAHYRLAEFAYAANNYSLALDNYSKVIQSWPDSKLIPYSIYGRGWARLRAGDAKAASVDFDLLAKQYSGHELANQTIYAAGMAAHQQGDHKAALRHVASYLQTNPSESGKADALYLQGLCYAGAKDTARATATLEGLLRSHPKYASTDKVLYELAWVYKNGAAEDKALSAFTRLTTQSPSSPLAAEANYHVAESAYAQKDYDTAIEKYRLASVTKAGDLKEKVNYKLGWSLYKAGRYAEAISAFDEQLTVESASNLAADARFMRGECFFKNKDYESALEAYEQSKAQPSRDSTMQVLTYLHAGQAASQLNNWKGSLQWTSELVKKFPQSPYLPQAKYEQAWSQRNLGQLDSALKLFGEVSSSRNELGARARFMAGEVLFQKKDYNAAILEFRRVMYGYGTDRAPAPIKRWQAKSGFEAGRCASVLAGRENDAARRAQLVDRARGYFQYVADKHPQSDEAPAALKQMQRLAPRRVGNRPTGVPGR